MANQNIIIDDVEYVAVSVAELSLEADVPTVTIDQEFPVTDDIKPNPPAFDITLKVFDMWNEEGTEIISTRKEQYETLKDLFNSKRLFKVVADFGIFESVALTSLRFTVSSDSANAFDANVTLQVIWVARLLPTTIQYYWDPATGGQIGITPSEDPLIEVPLTRPTTMMGEDPSMLDQIIQWFQGWWPW